MKTIKRLQSPHRLHQLCRAVVLSAACAWLSTGCHEEKAAPPVAASPQSASSVVVVTRDDGTKEYGQRVRCRQADGCVSPRPCCTTKGDCGYDVSRFGKRFEQTCVARHQPGVDTRDCADAAPLCDSAVCPPLRGCKLADGRCGVRVDVLHELDGQTVKQYDVRFGCVEATVLDGWRR